MDYYSNFLKSSNETGCDTPKRWTIYFSFALGFFINFFVSTSLWLWCVHSCAILMGKNHRITCETSVLKIARLFVFVLFGCSFYWISVWFNLHEILAVDTKREVKIILYLPSYGRYFFVDFKWNITCRLT